MILSHDCSLCCALLVFSYSACASVFVFQLIYIHLKSNPSLSLISISFSLSLNSVPRRDVSSSKANESLFAALCVNIKLHITVAAAAILYVCVCICAYFWLFQFPFRSLEQSTCRNLLAIFFFFFLFFHCASLKCKLIRASIQKKKKVIRTALLSILSRNKIRSIRSMNHTNFKVSFYKYIKIEWARFSLRNKIKQQQNGKQTSAHSTSNTWKHMQAKWCRKIAD